MTCSAAITLDTGSVGAGAIGAVLVGTGAVATGAVGAGAAPFREDVSGKMGSRIDPTRLKSTVPD